MDLHLEKLEQASQLVASSDLDAWLIFVRETAKGSDPVLPLLLEGGLTWQSALLLPKDGRRLAILGNYDADPLVRTGHWSEVIPYVQSIREPLVQAVEALGDGSNHIKIGLNYSTNDVKADGLTHGMYLLLQEYLRDSNVVFVSAEELAMNLRGRKTPEEVRRMREAIRQTEALFDEIATFSSSGKRSERDVYRHVHELMAQRGLGFAWDPAGDPIVNSGPNSMIGHGIASDEIWLDEGHVFHVDLGVIKEGYSSDLQRCWFVGETVPPDVRHGLESVNRALSAGAAALRPGVPGWEVDQAARESLVGDGYEEYLHAVGHQVGRVAHDGGTILGPKWERYGGTPFREVQSDEVYTLELGVILPGRGYLGIEEMVQVTDSGVEWLSKRQMDMPTLTPRSS